MCDIVNLEANLRKIMNDGNSAQKLLTQDNWNWMLSEENPQNWRLEGKWNEMNYLKCCFVAEDVIGAAVDVNMKWVSMKMRKWIEWWFTKKGSEFRCCTLFFIFFYLYNVAWEAQLKCDHLHAVVDVLYRTTWLKILPQSCLIPHYNTNAIHFEAALVSSHSFSRCFASELLVESVSQYLCKFWLWLHASVFDVEIEIWQQCYILLPNLGLVMLNS
jgi:hypothetical protein